MGCCGSSAKGDVAARDDDPERETSAFTPQKLKLLRETLAAAPRKTRERLRPGLQGPLSDYIGCGGGLLRRRRRGQLRLVLLGCCAAAQAGQQPGAHGRESRRGRGRSRRGRGFLLSGRSGPHRRGYRSHGLGLPAAAPGLHHAAGARPGPGAVGLGRRRRGARAALQGRRATTEAEAGSEAGRSAGPGRKTSRKTSRKSAGGPQNQPGRPPSSFATQRGLASLRKVPKKDLTPRASPRARRPAAA